MKPGWQPLTSSSSVLMEPWEGEGEGEGGGRRMCASVHCVCIQIIAGNTCRPLSIVHTIMHTIAISLHTTAISLHITAISLHITAISLHTTVISLHTTAISLHITAIALHTTGSLTSVLSSEKLRVKLVLKFCGTSCIPLS